MEIERAGELGLCFGVKRAVRLLKEATNEYGKIETLGPVVHNRQLVQELAKVGIRPVGELGQVQGKILAITAHGASPVLLSEIETRCIHIIDTTCPIVRKAQNAVKKLAEGGFDVIIFGEAEHPEVKGLLGWANGKGVAALDAKRIVTCSSSLRLERNKLLRLGIISQTTRSQSAFVEFIAQLIATPHLKVAELRIIDTLCQITQGRQEAATELARKSQLMLVVGGHDSANTRHLVEASSHIVETHLVEGASEVDSSWLIGRHYVGITAGTSTPSEAVEEVIAKLKSSV